MRHAREVVEAMHLNIPAWLYTALDQALVEAGATAPLPQRREVIDRLISAWNLEGRRFHNFRYLAHVFERLDELEGATSSPELLRLAMAFRGAIDELGWEEADVHPSPAAVPALVSMKDLTDLGISSAQAERIEGLVVQLAEHRAREEDFEARILIDADLASLAAPPQRYREFLENLRLEAANLSEEEFLRRREGALRHLLQRSQIFSTPVASQWEDAARENLEAELAATERKLTRLRAERDGGERSNESADSFGGDHPAPGGIGGVVDGRVRRDPRVLRISRAQKLRKLEADSVFKSAVDKDRSPARPSGPPFDSADEEVEATAEGDLRGASEAALPTLSGREASRSAIDEDQTTDTSTLESVADLVELARSRGRRSGGTAGRGSSL